MRRLAFAAVFLMALVTEDRALRAFALVFALTSGLERREAVRFRVAVLVVRFRAVAVPPSPRITLTISPAIAPAVLAALVKKLSDRLFEVLLVLDFVAINPPKRT